MNKKILTVGGVAIVVSTAIAFARPGGDHRGERPNPEDIVVEIVADYDANEDNVINVAELESAIAGLHEKRMAKMKAFAEERDVDRPRREREHGKREMPEPSEIAARLVANFDETGDEALDTEELLSAVDALHNGSPRGKRGPRGFRDGPRGLE